MCRKERPERLESVIEINGSVSSGIYRSPRPEGEDMSMDLVAENVYVGVEDRAKVREALEHFVRGGSVYRRGERGQAIGLVFNALKRLERAVGRFLFQELRSGDFLGRLHDSVRSSLSVCPQILRCWPLVRRTR